MRVLADEKGQITIEAILIMGFFVLVFFSITVPLAFRAVDAARDLSVAGDAKYAFNEIASAANSVVANGSKRTINVYIPGYNATSANDRRATVICTDAGGSNLIGKVILRNNEVRNFSTPLYGSGWSVRDATGANSIIDAVGRRHVITVTYKSITSNLTNSVLAGAAGVICP